MNRRATLGAWAGLALAAGCGGRVGGVIVDDEGGSDDAGVELDAGAADGGSLRDAPAPVEAGAEAAADSGQGPCVLAHRVVPTQNAPQAVVTDATTLYWFDDAFGVAAVFATEKCTAGPVHAVGKAGQAGTALALDAQNLYLATATAGASSSAGGVFAIDRQTFAFHELAAAPLGAWGVALAGGWVYWSDDKGDQIHRVRPDGTGGGVVTPSVTNPRRLVGLDDGTVCALGTTVGCVLPSGDVIGAGTTNVNPNILSTDGKAVYFASAASGPVRIQRFDPASGAITVVPFDAQDAGQLPLSGVEAVQEGVYVLYGEGTLALFPPSGAAPRQAILAQTLPPIFFYADDDGVYWDAFNGFEVGPGL